jgi:hypothetical protein
MTFTAALCCAAAEAPESREQAAYAAVFAALNPDPASKPAVVVKDRTAALGEILPRSASPRTELRQRLPQASESLVDDFLSRAKEPHSLGPPSFEQVSRAKIEVVPEAEVTHAFEGIPMAEAWRRLAERHGGARSVVTLSPVAYDDASRTALVYLGVACGGLCGGGTIMLLERRDGAWRVAKTQPLWN